MRWVKHQQGIDRLLMLTLALSFTVLALGIAVGILVGRFLWSNC